MQTQIQDEENEQNQTNLNKNQKCLNNVFEILKSLKQKNKLKDEILQEDIENLFQELQNLKYVLIKLNLEEFTVFLKKIKYQATKIFKLQKMKSLNKIRSQSLQIVDKFLNQKEYNQKQNSELQCLRNDLKFLLDCQIGEIDNQNKIEQMCSDQLNLSLQSSSREQEDSDSDQFRDHLSSGQQEIRIKQQLNDFQVKQEYSNNIDLDIFPQQIKSSDDNNLKNLDNIQKLNLKYFKKENKHQDICNKTMKMCNNDAEITKFQKIIKYINKKIQQKSQQDNKKVQKKNKKNNQTPIKQEFDISGKISPPLQQKYQALQNKPPQIQNDGQLFINQIDIDQRQNDFLVKNNLNNNKHTDSNYQADNYKQSNKDLQQNNSSVFYQRNQKQFQNQNKDKISSLYDLQQLQQSDGLKQMSYNNFIDATINKQQIDSPSSIQFKISGQQDFQNGSQTLYNCLDNGLDQPYNENNNMSKSQQKIQIKNLQGNNIEEEDQQMEYSLTNPQSQLIQEKIQRTNSYRDLQENQYFQQNLQKNQNVKITQRQDDQQILKNDQISSSLIFNQSNNISQSIKNKQMSQSQDQRGDKQEIEFSYTFQKDLNKNDSQNPNILSVQKQLIANSQKQIDNNKMEFELNINKNHQNNQNINGFYQQEGDTTSNTPNVQNYQTSKDVNILQQRNRKQYNSNYIFEND